MYRNLSCHRLIALLCHSIFHPQTLRFYSEPFFVFLAVSLQIASHFDSRRQYIDESTGEVRLLSESAVSRALRAYNLHPEQLSRPAPVNAMKSLHPNHCWQTVVINALNQITAQGGFTRTAFTDYRHKAAKTRGLKQRFAHITYIG